MNSSESNVTYGNISDDGNYTYYDMDAGPDMASVAFYYYLWEVVTPTIFTLITCIGTAGNLLVVYVIVSKPTMRTYNNLLLLNLALADISFLLICVPFTAYKYAASTFPFGDPVCKVVKYFLYVTCYVTIWTLVSISGLRFLTVVCSTSTQRLRTKANVGIFIFIIWVIMLAVNVPIILVHRVNEMFGFRYCGMDPDSVGPVFVTFFVFAYALPLFLICFLYLLIFLHLHRNKMNTSLNKSTKGKDRTTHVAKVLFTVVLVFCLTGLPLHVNSLLARYGSLPKGQWYEVFRILWNCLAYGNSCANPFIYNYVSADFRKAYQEIFGCLKISRRRNKGERGTSSEMTNLANGATQVTDAPQSNNV